MTYPSRTAARTHAARFTTRSVFATGALMLMASAGLAQPASSSPAAPPTREPAPQADTGVDVLMPQRSAVRRQAVRVSGVDVDVRLSDTLATTQMQITVENRGSATTQARLVLPVPEGASIRTFGIDGVGDEPTAQLLAREEASRRYHEIVRSMTDPGLLEFVGSALIQSSVFPVEPGKSRTMTIVYEQTLDAHRGRVEYVLPRSASMQGDGVRWSIDVELESSGPMGPVFSPSHPIVSKALSDHEMRVGVPVMNEPGPFRLYAVLGSSDEATCLLYPDASEAGSGYFMFVGDAPKLDTSAIDGLVDRAMREITVVIDRSGSMGGEKIKQAKESAKQIVLGLRRGEFVHIIDYSDDVRSFSDAPVQISDESLPEIIAYIDKIQSRGGTNLNDALLEALRPSGNPTLPMILFLTDGLPTIGERSEAKIRAAAKANNPESKRVFTFGLGLDVNAPLLDGLAMDTRAESTFVLPSEDVEMKVGQVFDKLDGPVMINPVFRAHAADSSQNAPQLTLVEPRVLGDIFSGSRVVMLGRYSGLPSGGSAFWVGEQRLFCGTGMTPEQMKAMAGPRLEARVDAKDARAANAFVARLWAQQRISSLINDIRLASADGSVPSQELVDEVVRLSLEHGIMTEYTAFLADESMGLEVAASAPARGQTRRDIAAANSQRSGSGGVSQSLNRKNQDAAQAMRMVQTQEEDSVYFGAQVQSTGSIASNTYYDQDMRQVRVGGVQRGSGATLYRKNNRWVDSRLGERAGEAPEITVEFDTEAYWALVGDLADQGRQWVLANRGDVYFINHGRRVLVKNPQ